MKKILYFLLLIFILSSLSGCNDSQVPIDPDDFGYPKINVLAKGKNITGKNDNQLSEWVDSGYQYNGDTLTIMVFNETGLYNSVWSSWYGANEDVLSNSMRGLSNCEIATPNMGDTSITFKNSNQPPCIFTKGQGLYLLLTNPGSSISSPNQYANINRNPSASPAYFYTSGLWNPIAMYSNNSLASGYIGKFNNSSNYIGGHAYFKILDKYYDDNSGGFNVALKRGFAPNQTPPITYVMNMIKETLNSTSETIFKRIVSDNNYLLVLKLVLTLYLIISGILFVAGILNMSQKELFFTFLKIIIVMQLLTSTTSWNLFNQYFFSFFTEGTNSILAIITSSISGQTVNGFTFFDNLLGLFFSYETTMKILALIVSVPSGIVVAGILYIAIAVFVISVVQGLILYLLAYIATCLLIILGPIFISFMLFKQTRSLFEGWLNQFAVYFFQPVLVFGALALLSQMIISTMYKILGFGICYKNYIVVNFFGNETVLMKTWQICDFSLNSKKDSIAIPGFGYWDSADPNRFCAPYECIAERYIALPFLDPIKDSSLIKAFQNPWIDLNMPLLFNSFILLVMTYLMYRFNEIVPDISKGIATGNINNSDNKSLGALARSSTSDMAKFASGTKEFIQNSQLYQIAAAKMGDVYDKVVPSVLRSKPGLSKEEFDDLYYGAGKLLGDGLGKLDEMAQKVPGYKSGKGLIKAAIPPISLSFNSREQEQKEQLAKEKEAWENRSMKEDPKKGITPEMVAENQKLAARYEKRFGSTITKKMSQAKEFISNPIYTMGGKVIDKVETGMGNVYEKTKNTFKTGVGNAYEKTKNMFKKRNNDANSNNDTDSNDE